MGLIIRENTIGKVCKQKDVIDIMTPIYNSRADSIKHVEVFYSMGLNGANEVLYIDLTTFGTVNCCYPIIREILRSAIVKNAVSIICVHNHPSGNVRPSLADNKYTRELRKACDVVGVKLIDHVIMGDTYYSYSDEGTL